MSHHKNTKLKFFSIIVTLMVGFSWAGTLVAPAIAEKTETRSPVIYVFFKGGYVSSGNGAAIEIAMYHKYMSSAYIGSVVICTFITGFFQYSDTRALDIWVNGGLVQSYSRMTNIGFPGLIWYSSTFDLDDGDTIRCRIKTAIFQIPYASLNLNVGPTTVYP